MRLPESMGYETFSRRLDTQNPIRSRHTKLDARPRSGRYPGQQTTVRDLFAEVPLDFIESFTPPPDCDLSIREARHIWPGKGIVCNFPSSVHHDGPEAVRTLARQLLSEASPGNGFALGVLENIPRIDTIVPLAGAIWEYGKTPIPCRGHGPSIAVKQLSTVGGLRSFRRPLPISGSGQFSELL